MVNNKKHPQVRLVRCPKCAKVLPEPEHVPLYTCGGCNTILQAKNYKGHHRNTALSSHEQNVSRSNDGGECSGSSRRSISSRENSETQGEVRIQAHVGILRNPEQNGTSISSDSTAMSKESNNHEQKGSANSAQHTALSEDTSFLSNKENGETDNGNDLSDLNDQAVDYPTVSKGGQSAQNTVENSTKEDDNDRDEQCNSIAVENHNQKQIGNMNCDSETSKLEDSQPLKNEELQQLPTEEKSTEDEDDQHLLRLRRHVNSVNNASSSSDSPAIEISKQDLASQHEVPEETRKMHLVRGDSNEDQNKQTQVKYVNSARNASSCAESPGMEKPTRFTSENPVDGDSSDQLSNETRNFDLIEKHSHLVCKECEQGNHPIKVVGYAKSAKEASSSIDSLDITKPMLLASERPVEDDVSYPEEQLDEGRVPCVSESELHYRDADKFKVEESGKEKCNQKNSNKSVDSIDDQSECMMHSSNASPSTEETQGVNVDLVYETKDSLETCGRDCVSKPSSAANLKTSHEMGTTKVSEDSHCESSSLDSVKESSMQNDVNFGDSSVLIESEVGSLLKENPESLSKRSPAYDGSVSSCDGNDDKIPEQAQLIGEENLATTNAVASYKSAEESPEWNSIPLERRINENLKVQPQDRSLSSMLIDEKLKSRMIEEEGLVERNGISQRNNRYRVDRDSFLPRAPYRRRSSEMTHETGSCSSYTLHDKRSSFHMHRHPHRRRFPEAPQWEEKEFLPTYYNSETSGEIYDRPKYHPFIDRRRRVESSQSGNLPQRPYSGELFSRRHSYMHRYPEERRWSSQLPPPAVYYHPGVHTGPSWETRWDPYDSYPTSPPRFVESESSYAWGRDSLYLSDDQRHKDQIMRRLYLKEKRLAVRKQFHPIAGGAPFITCYFCFNILELPADFLLSRSRKTHKLKCGACSRVLEFSLENEGCLAPSETSIDRNDNLVVTSRTIHSWQSSLNSARSRELLSQDSFSTSGREKRKIVPESSSIHNTEPTARGRPPKLTWQRSARSKSPLHRLMGYSSPKDLLTEHEADDVE